MVGSEGPTQEISADAAAEAEAIHYATQEGNRPGRPGLATSAGPAASQGSEMTPELALEMRAYRNARYHEDREGHFSRVNKIANFAVLILGSAAAAASFAKVPDFAVYAGVAVAITGGLQLVYDLAGNAAKHHDLRGKFLAIMAAAQAPSANVESINRAMVDIYTDEPEIYHAVNSMAYNAAQLAFDRPEKEPIAVSRLQALLRHWLTFSPNDFPDAKSI